MNPDLIKTLEQVQENVPVAMTSSFKVLAPFLRSAETQYVRNIIGSAQMEALKTYIDLPTGSTVDADLDLALKYCQKVISCIGYYFAVPIVSVSLSGNGIQIFSTDDTKNAFQWQVEDVRDALQELGFQGIEEMLEYLESKPDKFSTYMASEQYKASQELLIRSAGDFNHYYDIAGSRYVYQSILGLMRRVESQTMVKLFGAGFYESLKGSDITEKESILVKQYIKPALALLTASKALIERVITLQDGKVAFNFRGNYNNMKESQAATRDQLQATCAQLETDANTFLQDGLQYIADNPADFEDYEAPVVKRRFQWSNDPAKGVFGV